MGRCGHAGLGEEGQKQKEQQGHLPWDWKSDPAVNKTDKQAAVSEQEGRSKWERLEGDAEANLMRTMTLERSLDLILEQ